MAKSPFDFWGDALVSLHPLRLCFLEFICTARQDVLQQSSMPKGYAFVAGSVILLNEISRFV